MLGNTKSTYKPMSNDDKADESPQVAQPPISPSQDKDMTHSQPCSQTSSTSLSHTVDQQEASVCPESENKHSKIDSSLKTTDTSNTCSPELPLTKVAYICNSDLLKLCDLLPKVPRRATMVHSLIQSYGLLDHMKLISATPAAVADLHLFHSPGYVSCLERLSDMEDEEKYDEEADEYGLTYDCPAYYGVYDYAAYVCGGTIQAAQCLIKGLSKVAIHWTGGWHHCKRDEASGFCYLNDIVIGILKLRETFNRVLYIDLDLHHGDGVEDAFCSTSKVLTLSFHKHSPGFFPGTGGISDIGFSKGHYYTVNVPLKDGIQDKSFTSLFQRVAEPVKEAFKPDVVVCQCGADGLVEDPMDSFNLSIAAYLNCIEHVLKWDLPVLLLGGGGYNIANTSRCWASITGLVTGQKLPEDIPEHQFFTLYGPNYELSITPGNRADKNTAEYLSSVVSHILENIKHIE